MIKLDGSKGEGGGQIVRTGFGSFSDNAAIISHRKYSGWAQKTGTAGTASGLCARCCSNFASRARRRIYEFNPA